MKFSSEIKEIIQFIKNNSLHQGNILLNRKRKRNKSNELFDGFLDGTFSNEEEAASQLYGIWDQNYLKLRSRLIDDFTTGILMIDFRGQNLPLFSKEYYSILRELTCAKILEGKSIIKGAMFYAKRCYNKSKRLGHYDILVESIRILKRHDGTRIFNRKSYLYYEEELAQIKGIIELEDKAESYYSRLLINYKKNNALENTEYCQNAFKELSVNFSTCRSYRYHLFTRLIRASIFSFQHDFEMMLKFAEEDIVFYSSRKPINYFQLQIFQIQKVTACIRLGNYDKGLLTATSILSNMDSRNLNWFAIQHKVFFIHMQSGNYDKALKTYLHVTQHKHYKNVMAHMRENWDLGAAYLSYITELHDLSLAQQFQFRMKRFLNSVPEHSSAKRNYNIPVLIIQILYLLLRKNNREDIEDRINAIEKYCGRNLRDNEAVRSNAFIMMLLEIPKAYFNRQNLLRRIERCLKRFQEVPLHKSGKLYDLEIIPYERLWGYVLSSLK